MIERRERSILVPAADRRPRFTPRLILYSSLSSRLLSKKKPQHVQRHCRSALKLPTSTQTAHMSNPPETQRAAKTPGLLAAEEMAQRKRSEERSRCLSVLGRDHTGPDPRRHAWRTTNREEPGLAESGDMPGAPQRAARRLAENPIVPKQT